MKNLKERIYDCTPTEFDPTNKRRFTDFKITQGPRIVISYQRGVVDSEGNFQPSRPYDVAIIGKRAEAMLETWTEFLEPQLDELDKEIDKPGKTPTEERQEYLQGQASKIISDDSGLPEVGEPRTKEPDNGITTIEKETTK